MAKAWEEGKDTGVRGYTWSCKTIFQQTPAFVEVDVSPVQPTADEVIQDPRNEAKSPDGISRQQRRVRTLIQRCFRGQSIFVPSTRPLPADLVATFEWTVRGSTQRQYRLPKANIGSAKGLDFVDIEDDWEVLRQRRLQKARSTGPAQRSNQRIPPSRRAQPYASRLEQSNLELEHVETVAACSGCKSAKSSRQHDVVKADGGSQLDDLSEIAVDPAAIESRDGDAGLPPAFASSTRHDRLFHEEVVESDVLDGTLDDAEKPSTQAPFTTELPTSSPNRSGGTSQPSRVPKDGGAELDTADVANTAQDDASPNTSIPQDYTVAPGDVTEGTPFLYRRAARNALVKSHKIHASCPTTTVNKKPTRRRRRVTFSSQNAGGTAKQTQQIQIPQLHWSVSKDISFAKDLNRALNRDPSPTTPAKDMPLSEAHLNSILSIKAISAKSLKNALLLEMKRSGADISVMSPSPTPAEAYDRRHSSCPEAGEASRLELEDDEIAYERRPMPSTQVLVANAYQDLFSSPIKGGQPPPAQNRPVEMTANTPDRTPLKAIEHNQQAQVQSTGLAWSPWSTIKKPARQSLVSDASTMSLVETPVDPVRRMNPRERSRLYQSVSVQSPSQAGSKNKTDSTDATDNYREPQTSSQLGLSRSNFAGRGSQHAQNRDLQSESQTVSASLLASAENSWNIDQDIGDVSDYIFNSILDTEPTVETAMNT